MEQELQNKVDRRLGRSVSNGATDARVDVHEVALRERAHLKRVRTARRILIHVAVFVVAFMFSAGASTLSIILWVDPQNLGALVAIAVVASLVFVVAFAGARLIVLHGLLNDYEPDDDPGVGHHVGKSIAYALLALVLAMLLTGLIIQTATAARGDFIGTSYRAQ